jgi:hypothetical protein
MRIVKKEAKDYMRMADRTGAGFYKESDTVSIDKNWRPADWQKTKNRICRCKLDNCTGCPDKLTIEDHVSACLEALEQI